MIIAMQINNLRFFFINLHIQTNTYNLTPTFIYALKIYIVIKTRHFQKQGRGKKYKFLN